MAKPNKKPLGLRIRYFYLTVQGNRGIGNRLYSGNALTLHILLEQERERFTGVIELNKMEYDAINKHIENTEKIRKLEHEKKIRMEAEKLNARDAANNNQN